MWRIRQRTAHFSGLDAGAQVPIKFYRDGQMQSAMVTIAELPQSPELLFSLGLGLRERPADKEGTRTIIEVDRVIADSVAFQVGLRPGMRILAVGDPPVPVNSLAEFETVVQKLDLTRGVQLQVQLADGRVGSVTLGPPGTNKEP